MKEETNSNKITIVFNGKKQEVEMEQLEKADEFPWLLPDEKLIENTEEKNDESEKIYAKHKKTKWKLPSPYRSLLFSVTSAISIGVLFGLVLLSLFTQKANVQVADETYRIEQNKEPMTTATVTAESGEKEPNSLVPLSALSVYVVQAGAFSTSDLAAKEQQNIVAKGFPAEVFSGNSHYLFIGVGVDKESTVQLGQLYPGEVYVKQYDVPSRFVSESQYEYVETGLQLFHEMLLFSVASFKNEQVSFEEARKLFAKLEKIRLQNEHATSLHTSLQKSYEALQAYNETKDNHLLWEAQQYLLQSLKIIEEMQK